MLVDRIVDKPALADRLSETDIHKVLTMIMASEHRGQVSRSMQAAGIFNMAWHIGRGPAFMLHEHILLHPHQLLIKLVKPGLTAVITAASGTQPPCCACLRILLQQKIPHAVMHFQMHASY